MSKLIVTPAPHIKDSDTVSKQMRNVFIALIPALIASVIFFGTNALVVIITTVLSSVLFEVIILKIRKKAIKKSDISSSALTGLLLAFCVSSFMPWWIMILASFIAIAVAKHAFGGLGFNIFNPALAARAFILASWPVLMTTWLAPYAAITSATPLELLKENGISADYLTMFIGNHAGSIGETSAIALLIGALYLLVTRTIDFRVPASYLITVVAMSLVMGQDIVFQLLAGGLILGAFFMATDPVTSPVTKPGRWVFGAGCGFITMIIRVWGGYPEGVCYSILIMNAVVPLLDRYLQGRIFGCKRWNVV
ncbi:MAG: electron transport complex protein RnfD [Candidatus Saganbacteria bacterium]|uniref:Ion-translocating oxidoreductase complex subunit D n=1 Tax=Candidatus Saganbacteria bacterium TaxID=2575572 RepID=A0A833NYZ6_UNCSA|nr:MAG: electron transport complex protein RnfD [Candidatus Saganbacteria bacterium]